MGRDEHIVEHHRGKGVERVDEAYAIRRYQQAAALLPLRWQRLCRQVPEEQQPSACLLLTLLGLLRDKDMLGDVQTIDLSDTASVVMRYLDRFDVTFRWDADFDYKLDYLLAVVERLEVNEKGAIDMTQEGKASFIPG